MEAIIPPIRNTARALIRRDNNILLLRKNGYADGDRFALPGGGQDPGETLEQALSRLFTWQTVSSRGTPSHPARVTWSSFCSNVRFLMIMFPGTAITRTSTR